MAVDNFLNSSSAFENNLFSLSAKRSVFLVKTTVFEEIYFKKKTLYVSLSSSVLRQELSYGKQKIVDLINEEIGKNLINKIVLR